MAKYLSLQTSNEGEVYINADQVLYSDVNSSTAAQIHLGNGSHHLAVVGVALTSGFAMAMNDALRSAAETAWTNAVVKVELPGGVSVTSLAVTILS
tara:strand:+ start:14310 stop:14597 length:288 start_codon:yes stop_codon:yes gene_type:complete